MNHNLEQTHPDQPIARRPFARLAAGALALAAVAGVAMAGCQQPEDPGGYSRQRPPADRLDERDRGLQSFDVVTSASQMADALLTDIRINSQPERMLVVFDRAENLTSSTGQNLDLFLRQLRAEVSRRGNDRIQIIQNRETLRDLQSRELEQPEREEFGGVGGRVPPPGPAGIQPDYALALEVRDLPNRGTNYYQFDYVMTDIRTREIVWEGIYDVRVAR